MGPREIDPAATFSGFHRLGRAERLARVARAAGLDDEDVRALGGDAPGIVAVADQLVENAIGVFGLPLGVATNFRIDGVDRFVPMAVEETSVIAAASAAAKWVRTHGSLSTEVLGRLVVGQVQLPRVQDPVRARMSLLARRPQILERANSVIPGIVERGGGFRDATVRLLERPDGGVMLVLHLYLDPCDAMGANAINQACEILRPDVERWTGERVGLCILSNLVDTRVFRAIVRLQGTEPELAGRIEEASRFAELDPYRATTHNKGILNGVDAVLVATGNDWRAVEAGAHAWAARSGHYQPLSRWRFDGGTLEGVLEMPMAVGTVGGATRIHPTARAALRILGTSTSDELARAVVAVGIVQNLAALRALASEGIVRGHMRLHAANLALAVGATEAEVPSVRERLAEVLERSGSIGERDAARILGELRATAATRALALG